ncbi:MAG: amidohydrolase family protein [Proteobacteria bacterium]|nr:amidohydrolase family protein [Pseudomonadota bacterium]
MILAAGDRQGTRRAAQASPTRPPEDAACLRRFFMRGTNGSLSRRLGFAGARGSDGREQAMLDLLVRGGTVVTAAGVARGDVAVDDGKIVAVSDSGVLDKTGAERVVDASGKIVMPGGIDPHVHCNWPIPGPKGKPSLRSAPPSRVSRAALFGGTTTVIDFAPWKAESGHAREAIETTEKNWAGKSYCDYSYHLFLQGDIPDPALPEIREAIESGFPTVKIFTTNGRPGRTGRMLDYGDIWEVFQVLAQHGGLAAIHAEDDDIVQHMYGKLFRQGRVGFEHVSEIRNALSEDLSFHRIIRLTENVEGAAIYLMHISAACGVAAVSQSRAKGYPVYGETLHQYLLFTSDDYHRPNGQIYHTYPSLKTGADQEMLWQGTRNGAISTIATDEICTSLRVKVRGKRSDDMTGGSSGVEPRIGVMYTEMVVKRGYPLRHFVDLVSTNAAKIMGLYPRKGVLAVGSDADITILDPGVRRRVRVEDLHETDYSPWEGHEVRGWPTTTILRGKVVVEDGTFLGEPADGQRIFRKIADGVRERPFC